MTIDAQIQKVLERVSAFEAEAKQSFGLHSTTQRRVDQLKQTRASLSSLNLRQEQLFDEAIRCVTAGCHRAAHVAAWAAFVDFLLDMFFADGGVALSANYQSWPNKSADELREGPAEHQLIQAAQKLKLLTKAEMKTLHGLLSKRNECAHPSGYTPNVNEALGYISELLARISTISGRQPS